VSSTASSGYCGQAHHGATCPYLYRARNLVERFFNRIKQCRRIAARYDKLAANYLAFIKLAAIRIWPLAYESTP
jgi:transposase